MNSSKQRSIEVFWWLWGNLSLPNISRKSCKKWIHSTRALSDYSGDFKKIASGLTLMVVASDKNYRNQNSVEVFDGSQWILHHWILLREFHCKWITFSKVLSKYLVAPQQIFAIKKWRTITLKMILSKKSSVQLPCWLHKKIWLLYISKQVALKTNKLDKRSIDLFWWLPANISTKGNSRKPS